MAVTFTFDLFTSFCPKLQKYP